MRMALRSLLLGAITLQGCQDSPKASITFRATAKVGGKAVESLSLAPGQTVAIGMQAGQTLELDSGRSSVRWNPTSSQVSPVVNSNTHSVWKATIPHSASGKIDINIVAAQDPQKTATLTVYVAPPTMIDDDQTREFTGFNPLETKIVSLETTLTVPEKPPASGTLFLWPGLGPEGVNFLPIDNGVLQPVLTWGPSCAPGAQPSEYSTWWVSGQYVNTFGRHPGYTDCHGGPIMPVNVGDRLKMSMTLRDTTWHQKVRNMRTGRSVDFSIDMKRQSQNRAFFVIEEYGQKPVGDVVFTDTTITFSPASPLSCIAKNQGKNDVISTPIISLDGTQCSISKIVLR